MVTIAGTAVRSAVVAASQMQPMLSTARTPVASPASTLATTSATMAKPRVAPASNAYWRRARSIIVRRSCPSWITAGPMMTMKRDGRMQKMSGIVICQAGTCWAFSSAR